MGEGYLVITGPFGKKRPSFFKPGHGSGTASYERRNQAEEDST